MKSYEIVVIGSGSGMSIVNKALNHGLKTALVDKGPMGGTCLNLGCIPSKMLIYPADRIMEIRKSKKLGIDAEIKKIDFLSIMERMRESTNKISRGIKRSVKDSMGEDFYDEEAYFVDDYTLETNRGKIRGEKIFVVAGARPSIPPIKGLDKLEYLTNESLLELNESPESLTIIGGGYTAMEYAHFFEAIGTRVTVLQRNQRLVPGEEPEISEFLKNEMEKRINVHTNIEVVEIRESDGRYGIIGEDKTTKKRNEFFSKEILVATGRTPNTDLLKVQKTGVEIDERGFIKVNDYFETSKKNVWAFGDVIGRQMFRHVANRESSIVWHNAMTDHKVKMDYSATPHAVFTYPQIASVGMLEKDAQKNHKILVGKADYSEVAKGEAMMADGFAKAIVEKDSMKILGFHIIGPYAPILIQEVINSMASEEDLIPISEGMHIHPALPEIILATFQNLREVE